MNSSLISSARIINLSSINSSSLSLLRFNPKNSSPSRPNEATSKYSFKIGTSATAEGVSTTNFYGLLILMDLTNNKEFSN